MSHDQHVVDGHSNDLGMMSPQDALDYYLGLARDWTDPYPAPVVTNHEGVDVVRDDLIVGTKARAADLVLKDAPSDTVVYVAPRTGLAGLSLMDVANRQGKKVVLFMPACKRISEHQACCIEAGATPMFKRIAAMPNLNKAAREWAEENGAYFVPLGLKHPLATAALVKTARSLLRIDEIADPDVTAWVATSTGVLTRALQIAWPYWDFSSVCVARNMKAGELGRAAPISEPLPFLTPEREHNSPPYPSVANYDAKVWKYVPKNGDRRQIVWNVGKDPVLIDQSIYDSVNSNVDWTRK